jgi:hypothetical protein
MRARERKQRKEEGEGGKEHNLEGIERRQTIKQTTSYDSSTNNLRLVNIHLFLANSVIHAKRKWIATWSVPNGANVVRCVLARSTGKHLRIIVTGVAAIAKIVVLSLDTLASIQTKMLALAADVHLVLTIKTDVTFAAYTVLKVFCICLVQVRRRFGDIPQGPELLDTHTTGSIIQA